LGGIFEAEQRGKKESRLHRRNKGLGKLRFRPFPHRHICAAYFFRVAVFIVSQSPLRSSMEFVSLHRSIRFQYMRNSRSVGISFSHTFFDRVNLALRHCEGTANGSALGFDPLRVGNSLLQLHFGLRKRNKPATEEYGCERCNPATASTFSKSLFLPAHVLVMNVMTSFHPSLFAYLCQCVCNRP
jgi:hypothetical protein